MSMRFLRFSAVCLLFAVCASAQLATTTSLVGSITDSTGRAIPNASVTAVETGTKDKYAATTNANGFYTLDFVRVGTYNITVDMPGFQKMTKTGVIVEINQTVRNDIQLSIGSVSQSITVEAAVAAIKTDDASVSEIMSTRSVAELPLNGRGPSHLAP